MATQFAPIRTAVPSRPEFEKIVRTDELFATGTGDDLEERLNSSFDLLLIQAGLGLAPSLFLMLSAFSAMTLGGLVFVIRENPLTTALGFVLGGGLPLAWALIARSRRQQAMLRQLPEMVDELARAGRTGRSIEQCFVLVANDTASPLGDELKLCAGKLELGVGMRVALADLPFRTGLVSLNILVMALTLHVISGGDLISVLERLAKTMRDRMLYLARLRAATAASRATAIFMLVIPPAVLVFFVFRDHDYFTELFAANWGRFMTISAAVLDTIGIAWVLKILRDSRQT